MRTPIFKLVIGYWLLVMGYGSLVYAVGLSDMGLIPLRTEFGGRSLGLGGAYVAVSDDPNATFYNPGGLPFVQGISATLDQSFGGLAVAQAYPLSYDSTVGLALTSQQVKDWNSQTTFGNQLIFSYGTKVSENLGLGLNIKSLLGQTIQQTGSPELYTSGSTAIDFGLLWRVYDWFSLGFTFINLGGGELNWGTGQEKIPAGARLGAAGRLYWGKEIFLLSSELEYQRNQANLKVGSEYIFENKYAWRAGFNSQGYNLGASLRQEVWGVDLTSAVEEPKKERRIYLSFLYFPREWVRVKKEVPYYLPIEKPLEIISLKDNLVTYDEVLEISGKVKPGVEIKINRQPVFVARDGEFLAQVPLFAGKNLVFVETFYFKEKKTLEYKVLRKAKVLIAEEKKIEAEIKKAVTVQEKKKLEIKKKEITERKEKVEALVTMGVVEVTPEVAFELEAPVSRGELASWMVKAAGIPISSVITDVFRDVPKDHPLAFYIKTIVDLRLMTPFPDGTFRPQQLVTKKEGEEIFRKFGVIK